MINQDPRQLDAYERAKDHLGLKEIIGPRHNQTVVDFFHTVGHAWVKDDETAWCAAFVGAMLEHSNLPSTRALNARSYLDWGEEVPLDEAAPGDICVFWRGKPNAATGHVAFFDSKREELVMVLGGNQSNSVNIQGYPVSRLLSVRRFPASPSKVTEPGGSVIVALINWLGSLISGRRK